MQKKMLEKIKQLTKDTAIYGISTIVGRFLGFLLVPFYTNIFPPDQLGIYSNIYAYLAFFNIVYIYGMDVAFMKYASLEEESKKIITIFSTTYFTIIFSSILLSFILFLFKNPIVEFSKISGNLEIILYYLLIILFFDTLVLVPFAHLRLQRKAKKFAFLKIVNIVVNIALNYVLIVHYKMGIDGIFLANMISSILTFLMLISEILKYLQFSFDFSFLKMLFKFGFPYLPASLAAMIVQVIDRPLMLILSNETQLGIYSANYKLGIFMMLVVSMFQYAWQPFFLNNAKEENAKEIFAKVMLLYIVVASLIWFSVSLFIPEIIHLEFFPGKYLIGEKYWSGVGIVPIILLGYLFHGIYVNFQAGIYIKEKTKFFPYITFSGAIVNLVINILFIPKYGIWGAAFATLLSYFTMALIAFIFSNKTYPINYEYRKIGIVLLLITLSFIGLYSFDINSILVKSLLLIVFLSFLVITNILNVKTIKQIIRK